MPSVDDVLRHAFDSPDEEWVRRAPSAHGELRARHRRQRVVRRSTGIAMAAAALVVGVTVLDGDPRTRSVEPADPTPTPSSTAPAGVTPLEGTWTSAPLDAADVRAAARAAGAPETADRMLEQLPGVPFRVVAAVRGSVLTTTITSAGGEDAVLDFESLSVTGSRVEVRPFATGARTVHEWLLDGDRLTLSFRSSTEPRTEGVPGEAWQRLLYDSAPFTR